MRTKEDLVRCAQSQIVAAAVIVLGFAVLIARADERRRIRVDHRWQRPGRRHGWVEHRSRREEQLVLRHFSAVSCRASVRAVRSRAVRSHRHKAVRHRAKAHRGDAVRHRHRGVRHERSIRHVRVRRVEQSVGRATNGDTAHRSSGGSAGGTVRGESSVTVAAVVTGEIGTTRVSGDVGSDVGIHEWSEAIVVNSFGATSTNKTTATVARTGVVVGAVVIRGSWAHVAAGGHNATLTGEVIAGDDTSRVVVGQVTL